MGRPKKDQADSVPTREKIIGKATELFAEKSFDSVSIRDITGALGLNEASLYNHFKGKQELLEAILARLEEKLISPGFAPIPPEVFQSPQAGDLGDFLLAGGRRFFAQADKEVLLTWRILMSGQYRYPEAYSMVRERLLNGPLSFFKQIIEGFKRVGKIDPQVDSASAARILGALFFDYSFRSDLETAWGQEVDSLWTTLEADIKLFCKTLKGI